MKRIGWMIQKAPASLKWVTRTSVSQGWRSPDPIQDRDLYHELRQLWLILVGGEYATIEAIIEIIIEALRDAIIPGTDMHGAGVYGVGVHGAGVYGAEVHGAEVHGVEVHGAEVHGARVHWAGVLEAWVLEIEVLETEVLEAEANVQAQSIYMREPYFTEGGNPAQFMNTMEEEALYFMLILAHVFRGGYRGIVRLDFSVLQGALL
jgi:hypothetical protein